jgi:predicted lysophospholipase L1 biosynthesis ABC-type transport system permease subunit
VYAPKIQNPPEIQPAALTVEVRTTGPSVSLGSIAQAARAALPGRTLTIERATDQLNRSLALQRLSAAATAAFGCAGLCLAMIGLYGLNAYLTARRTAETGLRLALGASPAQVRLLVWRQSMIPVLVGVTIGAVLSMIAAQFFRGAIFGLADIDLIVLGQLVTLMSIVAAVACFVPAWRASRLNPTVALRAE